MSADALGYVFRHSPFTGAVFAVHLAIGDSVNDQHNNQFFMAVANLAKKTRLTRRSVQAALRVLEDRGFLTRLSEGKGETFTYQFEFCPQAVVFETRGRNQYAPLRNPRHGPRLRGRNQYAQTQVVTQGEGGVASQREDGATFSPGAGWVAPIRSQYDILPNEETA